MAHREVKTKVEGRKEGRKEKARSVYNNVSMYLINSYCRNATTGQQKQKRKSTSTKKNKIDIPPKAKVRHHYINCAVAKSEHHMFSICIYQIHSPGGLAFLLSLK